MFVSEVNAGLPGGAGVIQASTARAWKDIIDPVRPFLDRVARHLSEQVDTFDPEIAPYAQYALSNQGKQLRPALVALSGAATGKLNDSLVTVAVIIEMVHLATLVHDDVMDAAEIRRQHPTLAANWGNEISVLLGDCLFANALKLAASFPTPEVCRAVAAATNTVCSGEILQTHQRKNFELNRSEYFKVVGMKTAELFSLSCDLGAWLAGATVAGRNALRKYGFNLGTAYQIYDDCLDLFGNEQRAGKSLGTDLSSGKLTLPLLVVFEKGTLADQAALRGMIQRWEPAFFPKVLEILDRQDVLSECQNVIGEYLNEARGALAGLADSLSIGSLLFLTEFLTQQTEALGVH